MRKRETEGVTRRKEPDYVLFFVILTPSHRIMMVFSASMVRSVKENGHPYHFLIMQLIWAGIGLSAMFFLMNFDCWRYRSWAPAIFALSVLALILVLIPGIGQERQDARRWLGYGIATVQPAELAKFTIILFLADRLSRKRDGLPNLVRDLGPYLVMLGLVCLLVLAEPGLAAVGIWARL